MDWTSISDNILVDWINYELSFNQDNGFNITPLKFVDLIRLNDADKIARLTIYLNIRVINDQNKLDNLIIKQQEESDELNLDIINCNDILNTLQNL